VRAGAVLDRLSDLEFVHHFLRALRRPEDTKKSPGRFGTRGRGLACHLGYVGSDGPTEESLSRRSLPLRQRPLIATSADMATKSPGRGWRPGLGYLRTNVGGCPDALILPKDG
jgi:hypothetical protein